MSRLLIAIIGCIIALAGCDLQPRSLDENGEVLAVVGGRSLYSSELDKIIHPAVSREDSAALASSYINKWVREQLMMQEATKAFSSDVEIERLVADYREKLIKFNFEDKIIEERFDTSLTADQLSNFYEVQKEQFVLAEPIFRCIFVKIPNDKKGLRSFYRDWRRNKDEETAKYIAENASEKALDEKRWYNWADIEKWNEEFTLSRARKEIDQHVTDGDAEYFLRIKEYKEERSISPQSYINEQLKQMILHKRKLKIIEDYKTELYERAITNNRVQIR